MPIPRVGAVLVAAGRGERFGGAVAKQYLPLGGEAVIAWAARALSPHTAALVPVIDEAERDTCEAALAGIPHLAPVGGGATRQQSVLNGLEALSRDAPDYVLIHDAVRPFADGRLVSRVLAALETNDGAIPAIAVQDSMKRALDGAVAESVPREGLVRAQTPQAFRFPSILGAHREVKGENLSDDAAVAERAGLRVAVVEGAEDNFKITTRDDFARAERAIFARLGDVRTGHGLDVHRFGPGDHVWLCGVKVPHVAGLEGHSDADVGLHALTDAILGAIGAGDIGMHFPPSDERWRGAASDIFLARAAELVRDLKGAIAHVDVTVICERPKIGMVREAMRARIAEILALDISRVSVKATTTEGLGFTGRAEGIAAQATATVRLPA